MITQYAYLSLVPGSVPPVIHVSQYDNGTRSLVFTITDNGLDYTGLSIRIDGIKPDGKAFSFGDGEDFSITRAGNVVTSDCVTQMTAAAGTVRCSLVFYNEELDRLESADFVLEVKRAAIEDDATISETELPAIIELAKQEQDNAEQYMNAAEGFSFDAEAWAKGTRGEEPVASEDEAYQNNAKYYAGNSLESATLSKSWATGGTGARQGEDTNNAFFFSNKASSYATASAGSAEEAAGSATLSESWAKGGTGTREDEDTINSFFFAGRSAAYATASANYATAAAGSAGEAETQAKNAEAWATGERDGEPVPSGDDAYQNNAKYYADEAGDGATLAESYAHGGTGKRQGEDTDNAKYYMEQARRIAEGVTADEVYYDNRGTGIDAEELQTATDLIAGMVLANHFVTQILDDDGNEIADDDENSIMGDFKYQVA